MNVVSGPRVTRPRGECQAPTEAPAPPPPGTAPARLRGSPAAGLPCPGGAPRDPARRQLSQPRPAGLGAAALLALSFRGVCTPCVNQAALASSPVSDSVCLCGFS